MIEVIRPIQPDESVLNRHLNEIRNSGFYTNNGPLLKRLEEEVAAKLESPNLLITANGTLSLQLALRALGIKGKVVTTPFSYVATANAIEWQGLTPVFADLVPDTFFPDPSLLEEHLKAGAEAVLLTHVYGLCGPVEEYVAIAEKYSVPLIFDAAHAFDVRVHGKPIASFGDISCFSFHATKTFHMVEGGGIAFNDKEHYDRLFNLRSFGHRGDTYLDTGINAKNSEVHAAYGLAVLPKLDQAKARRKEHFEFYCQKFSNLDLKTLDIPSYIEWNYGYFPIVLRTNTARESLRGALLSEEIMARRYFYPSLNTLSQFTPSSCPNSEDMADRVLCIPMHSELTDSDRNKVADVVSRNVERA